MTYCFICIHLYVSVGPWGQESHIHLHSHRKCLVCGWPKYLSAQNKYMEEYGLRNGECDHFLTLLFVPFSHYNNRIWLLHLFILLVSFIHFITVLNMHISLLSSIFMWHDIISFMPLIRLFNVLLSLHLSHLASHYTP